MGKLQIRKTVRLDYSADEWDLFTDMDGVEDVAKSLNETFSQCVNIGMSRDEVESAVYKKMREYKQFGASDSEPERVLYYLLEKVFD